MSDLYGFEVTDIDGRRRSMDEFRGQVLLIVNVASQCVLTSQYASLEQLYREHHAAGLAVLGFPCDQFRHQEPGNERQIKDFCTLRFGVTFPMMAKVDVNGPTADPLFVYLKAARPGFLGSQSIKWNFTKFLVDRAGQVVRRFPPQATAGRIERALLPLLQSTVGAAR